MNRTLRKSLHTAAVLALAFLFTNLQAIPEGKGGSYRNIAVAVGTVGMLLLRKIDPTLVPAPGEPQPAAPEIPPAPKVIIRDRSSDGMFFMPPPGAFEVTAEMARACERRGLAYPATIEDARAARTFAAADALASTGPTEPPDASIAP